MAKYCNPSFNLSEQILKILEKQTRLHKLSDKLWDHFKDFDGGAKFLKGLAKQSGKFFQRLW